MLKVIYSMLKVIYSKNTGVHIHIRYLFHECSKQGFAREAHASTLIVTISIPTLHGVFNHITDTVTLF